MSFLCTNPFHTIEEHGSCTGLHTTSIANSTGEGDTGGETGGVPKPPPPPPPPPTGN